MDKIITGLLAYWSSLFAGGWTSMMVVGAMGHDFGFTGPGYLMTVAGLFVIAIVVSFGTMVAKNAAK